MKKLCNKIHSQTFINKEKAIVEKGLKEAEQKKEQVSGYIEFYTSNFELYKPIGVIKYLIKHYDKIDHDKKQKW